jgi:hypothetical protein
MGDLLPITGDNIDLNQAVQSAKRSGNSRSRILCAMESFRRAFISLGFGSGLMKLTPLISTGLYVGYIPLFALLHIVDSTKRIMETFHALPIMGQIMI